MENKEHSWNLWESRDDDTKSVAQEKSEHQSSNLTQTPLSIKEPQNVPSSMYSSQVFQPPYPPPGFATPSNFSQSGQPMPPMPPIPPMPQQMPPVTPFTFPQPQQAQQPPQQQMNGFFPFPPPFGYPPRFLPHPGAPQIPQNGPPNGPPNGPQGPYYAQANHPNRGFTYPPQRHPNYPPHLSIPPPASKQTEKELKLDVKSEYSSRTFIPSKSIEESVFMRGDVQMLGDATITGDTNLQGSLEVSENVQVKNRLKIGRKGNSITQIIEVSENNQHFLEIHTLERVYQLPEKKTPKTPAKGESDDATDATGTETGKIPENNEEITIKEQLSINSDEEIVEEIVEIIEELSTSCDDEDDNDDEDKKDNTSEESPSSPSSPGSPSSPSSPSS